MRNRAGTVLIEAIIAGVLLAMVAALGATLLRAQSRVANHVSLRSERNDAIRSAFLILRAELQTLAPAYDLRAHARDSITTRIFRGLALVCGRRDNLTVVRYRGLRLPDATKDSALQIGVENVTPVRAATTSPIGCIARPGEQVLAMDFGRPAPRHSLWLVFESGSYHLSANALRYRQGAESRQPITAELLDIRQSAFYFRTDSSLRAIDVTLRDRRTNAQTRSTIALHNAR